MLSGNEKKRKRLSSELETLNQERFSGKDNVISRGVQGLCSVTRGFGRAPFEFMALLHTHRWLHRLGVCSKI